MNKQLTLLDMAQIYWFKRFLACPKDERGYHSVPYEIFRWAAPKYWTDSYPNLTTVTWPG